MLSMKICLIGFIVISIVNGVRKTKHLTRVPWQPYRETCMLKRGSNIYTGSLTNDMKNVKDMDEAQATEVKKQNKDGWNVLNRVTSYCSSHTTNQDANLSRAFDKGQRMTAKKWKQCQQQTEDIKQIFKDDMKALHTQYQDVNNDMKNLTELVGKYIKEINKTLYHMMTIYSTSLRSLQEEVSLVNASTQAVHHTVSTIKRNNEENQILANSRHEEVKKLAEPTQKLLKKLESYESQLNWLMVVILACVGVTMIICVIIWNRNTPTYPTASTSRRSVNQHSRSRGNGEVYRLHWSGPMEKSVCVITFHSATETQHGNETRSLIQADPPPTIHTRVICRHTDIKDLPGCSIFLVYVDFNERNVILENPDIGLGDLRLTVVKSLLAFGGDVSVIYCGDIGSRNLGESHFNPDLTSIYNQPQLSQLKNHQRMFSIYKHFTDVQRKHCREFINRTLNGQ